MGLSLCLTILAMGCSAGETEPAQPVPQARDPLPAEESGEGPVILAFGNSLTAGHGVLAADSYPAQLQKMLDENGLKYRVINQGISGDTTSGGLSRIDAALALKPEIVVLELGANDGLRGLPVQETKRNLEAMIVRFQEAGAKVVLAGMTLPLNYGPDYIRNFENMYVDLAKQYKTDLIPFFLQGVAARADLNLDDGIHPTGGGYKIIAQTVFDALEPLLRGQSR